MESNGNSNSQKTKELFKEFMAKLHGDEGERLKKILISSLKKITLMQTTSEDLNTEIQNFIIDFEYAVQDFLKEDNPAANETNEEAIEGIVCKALHNKIISCYDSLPDERLQKAMKLFSFMELAHLESKSPILNSPSLPDAIAAFQSINSMKTPKEKLNAIVNSCKIVSNMILNCENQNLIPTGAEEFLPVLVWIVLQANPEKAHANVNFVRDYRAPHRFKGLEEYYHAAFESAIEFIESIDVSKLKIDKDEFLAKVEEKAKEHSIEILTSQSTTIQEEEVEEKVSSSPINGKPFEDSRVGFLLERISHFSHKIDDSKFRFLGKEVYNLTVSEVPDLIADYKGLVKNIAEMREGVNEMLNTLDSATTKAPSFPQKQDPEEKGNKRFFGFF